MALPRLRDDLPGARRRSPTRRFLALLALLAATLLILWALGLTEPEALARVLDTIGRARGTWWAPLVLVGLYLLFSPLALPVSPLVATGGAVFGLLGGWTVNMLGACAGAFLSFELGRGLGRDVVVRLVGPDRTAALTAVLDRHGFWALVRVRYLPLPFGAVNYAAALMGVARGPFVASTALGLAIPLLVYTQLGSVLANAASGQRGVAVRQAAWLMLLFFLLTFAPVLWRRLRGGRPATVEPEEEGPSAGAAGGQPAGQGPTGEDGGAEREAGGQQGAGADHPEEQPPTQ
jgi:uncharacterized membrane protein YdjX (TVP38/TMEM64 family)